jgi:hypothetical protein
MLQRLRYPIIKRHKSTIRQLTQDYGLLTIGVYGSLSFSTFCVCLYSVSLYGITQDDVGKVWNRLRDFVGIEQTQVQEGEESILTKGWKKLPAWIQTPENSQRVTNVLIAMGMTKLFSPFKLAITAMIVPPLGKRLIQRGWIKRK